MSIRSLILLFNLMDRVDQIFRISQDQCIKLVVKRCNLRFVTVSSYIAWQLQKPEYKITRVRQYVYFILQSRQM